MITAMVVIFVLLQVGDFLTTYFALEKGGVETNPIVKKVMDKFGYWGLGVVKLLPIITIPAIAYYGQMPENITVGMIFIFNMLYAYIVINNLNVIRKQRNG